MITSRLNANRRLPISEGRDVSTLNFFVTPARGKKDALNTITSTAGVEIVYGLPGSVQVGIFVQRDSRIWET